MTRFLTFLSPVQSLYAAKLHSLNKITFRTFLSEAYQCKEAWERRLNSPVLQKVNLDELYYNLEQRFQKTRKISAVDVDVFANAVNDDIFIDEMLDLVHKLRLTADTGNTLDSTGHAVIRTLIKHNRFDELLDVLDDRMNYGIFLDNYTGNLLLDLFWKHKKHSAGSRVASQFMLQEDFSHPITSSLSLLHCFKYLKKPDDWPILPSPPEPEEEVKIRVKYLRNPFDDDHFDLREPNKIVGKTIFAITKLNGDPMNRSFSVLGSVLYGKVDKAVEIVTECKSKNIPLSKEIIELLPQDNEVRIMTESSTIAENIEEKLTNQVEDAVKQHAVKDIENQEKVFSQWENGRIAALEVQKQRLDKFRRLEEIEKMKKDLKDKETKLWFFENEEKIELDIEAKKIYYPKKWFGKKKKPRKIDEGYTPPEVQSKLTGK